MRSKDGLVECVSLNVASGSLEYKDLDKETSMFTFDKVFGADSSQESVFEDTALPLIDDVFRGYNATILAYGQTGTGKTFTMEGDVGDDVMKGVIPRSLQKVFSCIQEGQGGDIVFEVKVSFIEIYMERIKDLLDPTNSNSQDISIREDKLKGLYVQGATEKVVFSASEVMKILRYGSNNRATTATLMNEESSRSHSVFTVPS
jgi:kinesin family protein 5